MSVQIDLDKPRSLKFDIRATRELEAALGGKPLGAVISDLSSFGVTAITTALFIGLKHEDPTINQPLVIKLLEQQLRDKRGLQPVVKALSDALEETGLFHTDAEDDEGNAKPEHAT